MKYIIDIPEILLDRIKSAKCVPDMYGSDIVNTVVCVRDATPYKESPQWIPCSERLPEEIGDYLVTEHLSDIAQTVYVSSFGHVRTGELCFYYEDDDGRAITNNSIVAWMPLPTPYMKEGKDE